MAEAIRNQETAIDKLPAERRARLEAATALDSGERVLYQERKSLAFALHQLDLPTAEWLYATIGEAGSTANGGWPEGVSLAEKVICTKLMAAILGIAA